MWLRFYDAGAAPVDGEELGVTLHSTKERYSCIRLFLVIWHIMWMAGRKSQSLHLPQSKFSRYSSAICEKRPPSSNCWVSLSLLVFWSRIGCYVHSVCPGAGAILIFSKHFYHLSKVYHIIQQREFDDSGIHRIWQRTTTLTYGLGDGGEACSRMLRWAHLHQ